MMRLKQFFAFLIFSAILSAASAAELMVAVAANFAAPMKIISQQFERETGHTLKMSFGGTGQFYAQIKNGAPFAVLLAADHETPAKIEREGLSVAGTRFTYAIGRLALWSKKPDLIDPNGEILRSDSFTKIAIANPKLAPYGVAAFQVLNKLGLTEKMAPRIVEGANIGQAYQFVASGNAPLGFVALSQVYENGKIKEGSAWIVPADLYQPLRQDAVLLKPGVGNPAADALLKYLKGEQAQSVMRTFGYGH